MLLTCLRILKENVLLVYLAQCFLANVLEVSDRDVKPVFVRNRASTNERIVNGEAAESGDFPWNAVLTYRGRLWRHPDQSVYSTHCPPLHYR